MFLLVTPREIEDSLYRSSRTFPGTVIGDTLGFEGPVVPYLRFGTYLDPLKVDRF